MGGRGEALGFYGGGVARIADEHTDGGVPNQMRILPIIIVYPTRYNKDASARTSVF